ncbi:branched-chain amino acid ABC transporter permease [Polaromonas sp. P1(28)-13]|nr:branched-chain amino acid ABC transporter permease [Polaromonas sp. P1(28)-13]
MLDPVFIAQTIVSGIGIGCVFGLIGIGYCVIYNASGIVNFAQGAFVMLSGMITHALLTRAGLPLLASAIIAVAIVACLGVVVERFVVRPLWHRNATPFVMILATLAVQIVLERATLLLAGDQPRTLPNFIDLPPLMIAKVAISYQLMVIAATSLLLVGLLAVFFSRTRSVEPCVHVPSTGKQLPYRGSPCHECWPTHSHCRPVWERSQEC